MERRTPAQHPRTIATLSLALTFVILCVFALTRATKPLAQAEAPSLAEVARPARVIETVDQPLRVRLLRDQRSIVVDADSSLRIGELRSGRFRERTYSGPVEIRFEGMRFTVRDHRGRTTSFASAHPLRIEAVAGLLRLNDAAYPGAFQLHAAPGAVTFDVIEHVDIEEYLPGVLTRELYPNWSATAYEAQAIAARSYALHERERRIAAGSHFDVESTTQDQAYGGAGASEKAHAAVRATRGVVLMHQGAILRAYYSSTCGGRPGSARDTWPIGRGFEFNLAAPIQATPRECPCEFSPRYRWTVTREIDRAVARIRAYGASQGMAIRDVGSIKSITPIRHNAAQRPAMHQITDRAGATWRLSAESLRLALNHSGDSGLGRPDKELTVWSGDIEITVEGDTLRIDGRGFGHGVGMCQFGAEGMARQGRTAHEILMHSYPGAEIRRP